MRTGAQHEHQVRRPKAALVHALWFWRSIFAVGGRRVLSFYEFALCVRSGKRHESGVEMRGEKVEGGQELVAFLRNFGIGSTPWHTG